MEEAEEDGIDVSKEVVDIAGEEDIVIKMKTEQLAFIGMHMTFMLAGDGFHAYDKAQANIVLDAITESLKTSKSYALYEEENDL